MNRPPTEPLAFSNRHLDLAARDEESVIGWRYEPRIVFSGGQGAKLVDVDGNEYYDCNAGMMCLVLGHAHPELVETIREQAERFVHQSSWFTNPWAIELAELVASTLPDGLEVTNYAVTGSEANEIAMRMALGVTGGFDICTVVRGLHGGSLAAESATSVGGARKRGLGPLSLPAVTNCIVPPFYYRAPVRDPDAWDEISLQLTAEMIEHTTSQEVGGILVEPMMVAGGMIVPSKRWMRGLREIADRWGALLIFDEAQLAPAKTGRMWGFEHYGVVPDVVTWAKGMSAGLPVCGTVTTREIAERAAGTRGLPWAGTYSSDPLPAAVALKQLQIVIRDGLVAHAAGLGETLRSCLAALQQRHECIGDVRGAGFYRVLDIVTDPETRTPDPELAERIRYHALAEGLVITCVKNYMRISPPLIMTRDEVDDMVGRLGVAIERAKAGRPTGTDFSVSSSLAADPV